MPRQNGRRYGLNLLPTRLQAKYNGPSPTYNRVYRAAVNCEIRATWEDGFWIIEEADEPEIAARFGMTPKASVSQAA